MNAFRRAPGSSTAAKKFPRRTAIGPTGSCSSGSSGISRRCVRMTSSQPHACFRCGSRPTCSARSTSCSASGGYRRTSSASARNTATRWSASRSCWSGATARSKSRPRSWRTSTSAPAKPCSCLKNGLWLLQDERGAVCRRALSIRRWPRTPSGTRSRGAAGHGGRGASLARIRSASNGALSRESCYRGRVLSLESTYQWTGHAGRIRVHALDPVAREDVILPEATLARARAQRVVVRRTALGAASAGTLDPERPAVPRRAGYGQDALHPLSLRPAARPHDAHRHRGRNGHPSGIHGARPSAAAGAGRHRRRGPDRTRPLRAGRRLRRGDAQSPAQRARRTARTRRRLFHPDDQSPGHARAGAREPARPHRSGDRIPAARTKCFGAGSSRSMRRVSRCRPIWRPSSPRARTARVRPSSRNCSAARRSTTSKRARPVRVSRATAESALHEMLFSGGTLNTRLLGGEAVESN